MPTQEQKIGVLYAGTSRHGNMCSGHYSEFEADGTLHFHGNATVFEDIDFPVIARTAQAGQPTPAALIGNLRAPQWAVNDFFDCQGQELFHSWKEGSAVYWHIHMYATPNVGDSYVRWRVEYTWMNSAPSGVVVPAPVVVDSADFLIPGGSGLRFYAVPIATFVPVGGLIAAHVKPRLTRIAATGAALSVNPFCEMLQLHVECDTVGSRQEWIK